MHGLAIVKTPPTNANRYNSIRRASSVASAASLARQHYIDTMRSRRWMYRKFSFDGVYSKAPAHPASQRSVRPFSRVPPQTTSPRHATTPAPPKSTRTGSSTRPAKNNSPPHIAPKVPRAKPLESTVPPAPQALPPRATSYPKRHDAEACRQCPSAPSTKSRCPSRFPTSQIQVSASPESKIPPAPKTRRPRQVPTSKRALAAISDSDSTPDSPSRQAAPPCNPQAAIPPTPQQPRQPITP